MSGATGFLGSRLCAALASDGFRVVGLKRSTSDTRRVDAAEAIELVDVDSGDWRRGIAGMGPIATVVHAAADYGRGMSGSAAVHAANVELPHDLLLLALETGADTFVNTDTILPAGVSAYAAAKRAFVETARALVPGREGMRFLNLRLQTLYGPGDDADKFVMHVVKACASGQSVLELTTGVQARDFVYVDDVVSALALVVARRHEMSTGWVDIDVGSGHAVPVREVVRLVHRLTGSRTRLDFGARPHRPDEVMFSQADIGTLEALGWSCRTTLEDGLRLVVEQELAVA